MTTLIYCRSRTEALCALYSSISHQRNLSYLTARLLSPSRNMAIVTILTEFGLRVRNMASVSIPAEPKQRQKQTLRKMLRPPADNKFHHGLFCVAEQGVQGPRHSAQWIGPLCLKIAPSIDPQIIPHSNNRSVYRISPNLC